MLVIGGRDSDVSKPLPTAVYDTEACEWRTLPSVGRVSSFVESASLSHMGL